MFEIAGGIIIAYLFMWFIKAVFAAGIGTGVVALEQAQKDLQAKHQAEYHAAHPWRVEPEDLKPEVTSPSKKD